MSAARHWLWLLAPWAFACTLEANVQHQGDYAFLPGTQRPDTAPRALHELLIVEDDALLAARRYYYFTGDLGPLGIGIESLPRLIEREGRYSVLFENPFDAYAAERSEDDAGPEDNDAEPAENPPEPEPSGAPILSLDADGSSIPLLPFGSSELVRVGASRFVGSLESGAFSAKAFLGQEPSTEPLTRIRVPSAQGAGLEFAPDLEPGHPELTRVEEGLALDPGLVARPDYLIVELYQRLWLRAEERPVEAVLRISIAPSRELALTADALSNSFHALCWSEELPLFVRVIQVARSVIGAPSSESALIQRHADTEPVSSDWTDLLIEGTPPEYCSAYGREPDPAL